MTSPFDPDELLRSANPVDEARLLAPSESATARRLFEKITGVGYLPKPEPPYRRRWRVYATSIVAAIAVGGGVAYAVTYRQPTKRLDVECFSQPSLTGTATVVPSNGRDPITVCREVFTTGGVGSGEPTPNLEACVLASGAAGVFPAADGAGDVCRRLGLAAMAVPSPRVPAPFPAVAGLRDRLVAGMSGACLGLPQAEALVVTELRRARLTDWTVTVTTPFSPGRPCASPGFDEPGRRVLIVPVPPPGSG
jgi:hypothetical protein